MEVKFSYSSSFIFNRGLPYQMLQVVSQTGVVLEEAGLYFCTRRMGTRGDLHLSMKNRSLECLYLPQEVFIFRKH